MGTSFQCKSALERTVDMAGIVGATLQQASHLWDGGCELPDGESRVTEGRKSFAARVPVHENSDRNDLSALPTPVRSGVPGSTSPPRRLLRAVISDPLVRAPTFGHPGSKEEPPSSPDPAGRGRAVQAHRAHPSQKPGSRSPLPGLFLNRTPPRGGCGGLLASAAAAVPPRGGFGARSSPPRRADYSDPPGSGHYLPPGSPGALPGASTLQPISRYAGLAGGATGSRLTWDDFLGHCGISFPAIDPSPPPPRHHGPDSGSAGAAGPASQGLCPQAERAAEALSQRRSGCLEQAARELAERAAASEQKLRAALRRFDDRGAPAPAAVAELAQVLDSPKDLEACRARVKAWQAACKDEAWLRWYAAKREWLTKDLTIIKEHNEALRRERAVAQDDLRRAEAGCKCVRREARQLQHRADARRQERLFRELADEQARTAKEDLRLMRQKLPEAESALEARAEAEAELQRQLAEARLALGADQAAEKEARRAYLRQRARRVALELQRYARTCVLTSASTTGMELTFRGGARASVVQASAHCPRLARVVLRPPGQGPGSAFAGLRAELFANAWRGLVSLLAVQAADADAAAKDEMAADDALQAVVPTVELPQLIRQLDHAALRIADQFQAIRDLPLESPEAAALASALRGGPGTGKLLEAAEAAVKAMRNR